MKMAPIGLFGFALLGSVTLLEKVFHYVFDVSEGQVSLFSAPAVQT